MSVTNNALWSVSWDCYTCAVRQVTFATRPRVKRVRGWGVSGGWGGWQIDQKCIDLFGGSTISCQDTLCLLSQACSRFTDSLSTHTPLTEFSDKHENMVHTKHNAASLLSRKQNKTKKQTKKLTTLISDFAHWNCSYITTMRYVVHTAHNIYTGSNSTQNVGGYDFKTSIQNRLKIPVLRSRGVGLRWEGAGEVSCIYKPTSNKNTRTTTQQDYNKR